MLLCHLALDWLCSFAGRTNAADRDYATAAAAAVCISNGANIIRAHNVGAVKDAAMVADAMRIASRQMHERS